VIINNHNYGRFVGAAIRSALEQTHEHTQVVVVDDGSMDDSAEVIGEYADRSEVIFKANGGQGSAFNVGYRACDGDVVIFLDADDVLLPEAAAMSAEALSGGGVSKATWQMQRIGPGGFAIGGMVPAQPPKTQNLLEQAIAKGPLAFTCAPTSGNAWPRWFLERVMPVPESDWQRGADGYLLVLSAVYGEAVLIGRPVSCYRQHGQNFLTSKSEFQVMDLIAERYRCLSDCLAEHLDRVGHRYDRSKWRHEHWERLRLLRDQVDQSVPAGEMMILADGDTLNMGNRFFGRPRRYLPERDGGYWGEPLDSGEAIQWLERLRHEGARYMALTWYQLWWLDEYPQFRRYLEKHYACVSESPVAVVYHLVAREQTQPLPQARQASGHVDRDERAASVRE
jgi:glycosyltransferase involved in cell wall biosynthesis